MCALPTLQSLCNLYTTTHKLLITGGDTAVNSSLGDLKIDTSRHPLSSSPQDGKQQSQEAEAVKPAVNLNAESSSPGTEVKSK